ncbi:MAG TPA: hypothetical protein DIU15_19815 [Deltaproteobacteria bacterium]|nr:hypothetical protein [Deltaproteobacteria bacterium]
MGNARTTSVVLALAVAVYLLWELFVYSQTAALHSDEFNALLHAHKFMLGEFRNPGRPGLLWLLLMPLFALDEPAHIVLASRAFAWLWVVAGALAIAWMAMPHRLPVEDRQGDEVVDPWLVPVPALALVLLLVSGYYAPHSIEVRTDTFTTPLALWVILLLWRRPSASWHLPVAAALVGASVLISQKAVYATVGLSLAWLLAAPTRDPKRPVFSGRARDVGVAFGVCGSVVGGWYLALSALSGGTSFVTRNIATARNTAFSGGVASDDKWKWLTEAVERDPVLFGGAALAILPALWWRGRDGRPLACLIVGATMLGVIELHRGYFPYYIASALPFFALPAAFGMLRIASAIAWALSRLSLPRWVSVAVPLLALGFGLVQGLERSSESLPKARAVTSELQLDLLEDVKSVFPEPVPYLAGIGVVPGYKELAGYMTGDRRRARRAVDRNFFRAIVRKQKPRFFIRTYMSRDNYLRWKEAREIYRSYLPYRPSMYVHGGRAAWNKESEGGQRQVRLLFDGPYTVRLRQRKSAAPPWLKVDGATVEEGQVLQLKAGKHTLAVGPSDKPGELWLIAGEGTEPEPVGAHVDYSRMPKDRAKSRLRYQRYDNRRSEWDLMPPPGSAGYKRAKSRHKKRQRALDRKYRKTVVIKPFKSSGDAAP